MIHPTNQAMEIQINHLRLLQERRSDMVAPISAGHGNKAAAASLSGQAAAALFRFGRVLSPLVTGPPESRANLDVQDSGMWGQ